jgi:hypothetical protein
MMPFEWPLSELVGRWVAVEAYVHNSSILAGLIPLGTVVTKSVGYSMVFTFCSPSSYQL